MPQLCFQTYIYARQENAFGLFPELRHISVSPLLLALSILGGAKACWDNFTKLREHLGLCGDAGAARRIWLRRRLGGVRGARPSPAQAWPTWS